MNETKTSAFSNTNEFKFAPNTDNTPNLSNNNSKFRIKSTSSKFRSTNPKLKDFEKTPKTVNNQSLNIAFNQMSLLEKYSEQMRFKKYNAEQLYAENIRLKGELMKKVKEVKDLENEIKKLKLVNNSNIKSIERVIYQGGITNLESYSADNSSPNNPATDSYMNVKDHNTMKKLKEIFVINNLKKQILSLNMSLKIKDEEIEQLKNDTKIAKYKMLESEYECNLQEFKLLKDNYSQSFAGMKEAEFKLIQMREDRDNFKLLYTKTKEKLDENMCRFTKNNDDNKRLVEQKQKFEEKIKTLENRTLNYKNMISEKDKELETYKADIGSIDKMRTDTINLEKKIQELNRQRISYKNEAELKSSKIQELELQTGKTRDSLEYAIRSYNKKKKDLESEKETIESSNQKLNIKISQLETEALELKGTIEKLNREIDAYKEQYSNELQKRTRIEGESEEKDEIVKSLRAQIEKRKINANGSKEVVNFETHDDAKLLENVREVDDNLINENIKAENGVNNSNEGEEDRHNFGDDANREYIFKTTGQKEIFDKYYKESDF